MDHLFQLQFACFLFMLFNAFTLAVTRLQTRWLNPRYERARWLIFVGIMGLAAHYLMQMRYGFRAVDDAVGATVNALVYAPCFRSSRWASSISRPPMSAGGWSMRSAQRSTWRSSPVSSSAASTMAACASGPGSMPCRPSLPPMWSIASSSSSARSSGAVVCWRRWRAATSCPMYATPAPASSSSFSRLGIALCHHLHQVALLFAPLGLMAFLFFVLSFVALGYSYQPKESLLDEEAEEKVSPAVVVAQQEKTVAQQAAAAHGVSSPDVSSPGVASPGEAAPCDGAHAGTTPANGAPTNASPTHASHAGTTPDNATPDNAFHADAAHAADQAEETQTASLMPEDRRKQIQQRLDEWCAAMGYKDGG